MNQDAQALYKLIVLYFLSRIDFPITNAQISDFMLNREYASYFNIQHTLSELEAENLIEKNSKRNRSFLFITSQGREILSLCHKELSDSIKEEIKLFIKEHHYQIQTENSCLSDYEKHPDGSFQVTLSLLEQKNTILSLSIQVPNEENALSFCERWPEKSAALYEKIMKGLIEP